MGTGLSRGSYVEYDAKGTMRCLDDGTEIPVRFRCSQHLDGTIAVSAEIEGKDHSQYFLVLQRLFQEFLPVELVGKTEDGETIIIGEARIASYSSHLAAEITLSDIRLHALQFDVKGRTTMSEGATLTLRFGITNFRLFRASVQTRFGNLIFANHPQHEEILRGIENYKETSLTCFAMLTLDPSIRYETAEGYLNAVKDDMARILTLSSFAQGSFQDWMFCEVFEETDGQCEMVYAHHRLPRMKPTGLNEVIYSYAIAEYLSKTYPSYGDDLDEARGFNYALGWYLESLSAEVIESRFLLAFISLELLVDRFETANNREFVLDKRDFKQFLKRLQKKAKEILEEMGVECDRRGAIHSGLIGVNRYSTESSLKSMLAHYRIGHKDVISNLNEIISIRNEIVHRGVAKLDGKTLLDKYVRLMCLIQRTLLSFLDYDGSIVDWSNGYKVISFARDPLAEFPVE
jgi:hypothetical protein